MSAKSSPAETRNPEPDEGVARRSTPPRPRRTRRSASSPSSPMFTTPDRSLNIPPRAAKIEGRGVADGRGEQRRQGVEEIVPLLSQPFFEARVSGQSAGAFADDQLDQLGGGDEQQDHGEQYVGELQRHLGGELHLLCRRRRAPRRADAPSTTPAGWLRPSSATPMPLKPRLETNGMLILP